MSHRITAIVYRGDARHGVQTLTQFGCDCGWYQSRATSASNSFRAYAEHLPKEGGNDAPLAG